MSPAVLGRTNWVSPPFWWGLLPDGDPLGVAKAALETGYPLDVSSAPGLWGPLVRGAESPLVAFSGFEIERATSVDHASGLVQGHVIQVLSCLGRQELDFYMLQVRRGLEEHQIAGALEALDSAKQDGLVRYIGLSIDGPALAVLGLWKFNDAFEVVVLPSNPIYYRDAEVLRSLAQERRVGVVCSRVLNWCGVPFPALPSLGSDAAALASRVLSQSLQSPPILLGVRSPSEVRVALSTISQRASGLEPSDLPRISEAYADPRNLEKLATDQRPWIRKGVQELIHRGQR